MSSMIVLVSMNLTGYVQCILCVDSLLSNVWLKFSLLNARKRKCGNVVSEAGGQFTVIRRTSGSLS